MTKGASSTILQLIRRVALDERVRQLSDPELLRRFAGQGDEAAFHALLLRHGPMVLEVCRGVLGNEADAEDAFQATFLILARKASSIRKTESCCAPRFQCPPTNRRSHARTAVQTSVHVSLDQHRGGAIRVHRPISGRARSSSAISIPASFRRWGKLA